VAAGFQPAEMATVALHVQVENLHPLWQVENLHPLWRLRTCGHFGG
jgi:hypothetical protein